MIADKAGYIVWRDSKVVIFYTNDLLNAPTNPILDGDSEEAILCVRGLGAIRRWTGTEILHRSTFQVPAPIVAYNQYMNSVDRMDQRRAVNPTRRREKRLHMSIFTYLLDLAVHNAYAIYVESDFLQEPQQEQQMSAEATEDDVHMGNEEEDEDEGEQEQDNDPGVTLNLNNKMTYLEFKRQICEQLVEPFRRSKHLRRLQETTTGNSAPAQTSNNRNSPDNVVGSVEHNNHMLIENKEKRDINCFFCVMRGI